MLTRSPESVRCLAHAHIGCTCGWDHKTLLLRLPDHYLMQQLSRMQSLARLVSFPSNQLFVACFYFCALDVTTRDDGKHCVNSRVTKVTDDWEMFGLSTEPTPRLS